MNHEQPNEENFHNVEQNVESNTFEPTKKIQDLFINLAEENLNDDAELKQAVIDFYSDTERLDREIRNVFAGRSAEEANQEIEQWADRFADKTEFRNYIADHIEAFQSTTERANGFKRQEARLKNEPVASQDEYELGVYKDALESQVADAVFLLKDKGYYSFESGMDEDPESRSQFIGFYNTDITVPTDLADELAQRGFAVSVEKMDDRVQLRLTPLEDRPVRLSEWESVWSDLAKEMPQAKEENFEDVETYTYHQEFRDYQDKLKTSKEREQEEGSRIDDLKNQIYNS